MFDKNKFQALEENFESFSDDEDPEKAKESNGRNGNNNNDENHRASNNNKAWLPDGYSQIFRS